MVDTPQYRYQQINAIVDDINAGNFELPPQLLNVAPPMGYSSPKVRELLHRLVSLNTKDMTYLEIGVHTGSTFFAATYQNDSRAVAIDNWSLIDEFNPPGGAEYAFLKNFAETRRVPKDHRRISFIKDDCFSVNLGLIPQPVTIYFYDGDHGRSSQYRALTYYHPVLSDRFIFIVDDFNWAEPKEETYHAIKDLGFKIVHEWVLKARFERDMENWWNGLFVGVIEKG